MRLFDFSKKIFIVISIFGLCCGCGMLNRNVNKQISQSFGDLDSIELDVPIMVHASDNGADSVVSDINIAQPRKGGLSPKINPGMLLNISVEVAGKDEIYKESCNVSRDGDINLPLLKNVTVVGLTVVEAEKKLTKLCGEYFVEPQVDISFSRSGQDNFVSPWGYVTVMGNVVEPRRIALPQGRKLKLSEAVALAGGLAPSAKSRSVVLIRRDNDGKVIKKKVNLRSIMARGKIDRDVELLPNDYIFVPETIF